MSRPEVTTDHKDMLLNTLDELGWTRNNEKSQLVPGKQATFISFKVYSTGIQGPWIKILPETIRKLKRHNTKALHSEYISARNLVKITGQCVAMMKAILPAQLLLRNAYRLLSSRKNWDSQLFIDDHCGCNLRWWRDAVTNWNGTPLCQKSIDIQIETDASGTGWGGYLQEETHQAAGFWNRHRLHGIKLLRTASNLKNTPIISTHTAREKGSSVKQQRHSYCIPESIRRSKSDYDRSHQGHFHVLQGEQYYRVCRISRRSEQCESRRIVKEEINI